MGFNCLQATEPPQGDSLLFTAKSKESSSAHLSFDLPQKDERLS